MESTGPELATNRTTIAISAPIHHHLEAKGWGEAKIVMRFWVIAGVLALIGVFLATTGGIV